MAEPEPLKGARRDERRVNDALRTLVDEMLTQIRSMSGSDRWSSDERAQAELDLERVMEQVRREARSVRSRG